MTEQLAEAKRRWEIRWRRLDYNGGPVSGTTGHAECAACTATPADENLANMTEFRLEVGTIGLCATCDAGPFCDPCAEAHEATANHPATL